jgi:hypothetical protein
VRGLQQHQYTIAFILFCASFNLLGLLTELDVTQPDSAYLSLPGAREQLASLLPENLSLLRENEEITLPLLLMASSNLYQYQHLPNPKTHIRLLSLNTNSEKLLSRRTSLLKCTTIRCGILCLGHRSSMLITSVWFRQPRSDTAPTGGDSTASCYGERLKGMNRRSVHQQGLDLEKSVRSEDLPHSLNMNNEDCVRLESRCQSPPGLHY